MLIIYYDHDDHDDIDQGLWDGYDHWAGRGEAQALLTLSLGLALLTLSRSLRSAQSMLIGVNVDVAETHIQCDTYLGTDHQSEASIHVT